MTNLISKLGVAVSTIIAFSFPVLAQDKPSPTGSFGSLLPMMLVMFIIIYFLMIRPEQKRQKERSNLLKNLKKGDKVVTAAGMMGVVANVKDNTVMVKISDNTTVEFTKSAITNVLSGDSSEKTAVENKEKK